jgi:hypothetical protein
MAVKAVAERSLHPIAKRFLFRFHFPSSTIVVMWGRYRLSGTEEVAGFI